MGVRVIRGNAEDGGFILNNRIHITKREIEILSLAAMGVGNRVIAKKLGVGENTVRNHIYNVTQKLRANNRAHAVVVAIENGIIAISRDDSLEWSPEGYRYCIQCERVFRGEEIGEIGPYKVIVNHVKCEMPGYLVCPNCGAHKEMTLEWKEVRRQHPEYPDTPKRDKEYSYDWLKDVEEDKSSE